MGHAISGVGVLLFFSCFFAPKLKTLLDKGLITQDEYGANRQQIIDGI